MIFFRSIRRKWSRFWWKSIRIHERRMFIFFSLVAIKMSLILLSSLSCFMLSTLILWHESTFFTAVVSFSIFACWCINGCFSVFRITQWKSQIYVIQFSVYFVLPHDFPSIYMHVSVSVCEFVYVCELNFRILLLLVVVMLLLKRHTAEVHELWLLHRAAKSRYIHKDVWV